METLVHGSVTIATPKLGREGGRGLTIPLQPALRSTASPQTVLRGTMNPSSRRHGWGANGPLSRLRGQGGTNIPISGLDGEVE